MTVPAIVAGAIAAVILSAVLGLCISRQKRSTNRPGGETSAASTPGNELNGIRDGKAASAQTGDVTLEFPSQQSRPVAEPSKSEPGLAAPEAAAASVANTGTTPATTRAPPEGGAAETLPAQHSNPVEPTRGQARTPAEIKVSDGTGTTFQDQYTDSAAWAAYKDQVQQMALPPPQAAATGSLLSAWKATQPSAAEPPPHEPVLRSRPMTPAEALARLAAGSQQSSQAPSSSHSRREDEKKRPVSIAFIPVTLSQSGKGSRPRDPTCGGAEGAVLHGLEGQCNGKATATAHVGAGGPAPRQTTGRTTGASGGSKSRLVAPPVACSKVAVAGSAVRMDISVQELNLGEEIGRGGFGRVHSGTYQGKPVAVKMLLGTTSSRTELEALELEISILSHTNHPHVMKIYGGNLSPPQPFIVAELLMCSLHDYIYHPQADTRVLLVVRLARGIAGALSYLHPAVLHRDLKPGNVLLSQEGEPKVADFGLARWKLKTLLSTQTLEAGSVPYLAPECFDPENWHLTDRVDVYSLAVIISEMLMRTPPWHGMTSVQVAWEVHVQGRRPALPPPSAQCPKALLDLVEACWTQDPKQRPPATYAYEVLCQLHDRLQAEETGA